MFFVHHLVLLAGLSMSFASPGDSVSGEEIPSFGAKDRPSREDPGSGLLNELELPSFGGIGGGERVRFSAEYQLVRGASEGRLAVRAELDPGWHIYSVTQQDGGPQRSRIELGDAEQLELRGPFEPDGPPQIKQYPFFKVPVEEHGGQVTWTAPIRFRQAPAGESVVIRVRFNGQICDERSSCIPIQNRVIEAKFAGYLEPVSRLDLEALERLGRQRSEAPMAVVLLTAFAAGFLLNFMPCVLPVIGLKIMGFVQQAGDSRGRVFLLNVWYSLGLISVFMVLASLAVFAGIGWGEQFQSPVFNLVLSAVVFSFALSFLGVWEIPIPGFAGSGKVQDLAQREGAAGAFVKGALTTVLATPCTGPMLGSALTWAVTQPPAITYLGFACVGLGMASPYLAIGAFPRLLAFLPKPGEWMETFKHIMGFVLMGTVVYLLAYLPVPLVVPTVAFLFGLWAAFWWIGRMPLTESLGRQLRTWLVGGAVAAMVGLIAFDPMLQIMDARFQRAVARELSLRGTAFTAAAPAEPEGTHELAWQPFSLQTLEKLVAERKTVLVDFTADWCLTCKSNEQFALNQEETRKFIEAHGVAALKADKTYPAPEVDDFLRRLGNKSGSIPFYAIFPGGDPNKPILLDGLLTSPKPIIEAMKKALEKGG